jgi:hypothetical protein
MKPIGQFLRKQGKRDGVKRTETNELLTIEAQIRALESSLDKNDEGVNSDDSEVDDNGKSLVINEADNVEVEVDKSGRILRLASKLSAKDRIAPLPPSSLPIPMCSKSIRVGSDKKRTAVKFSDEDGGGGKSKKTKKPRAEENGLEKTVREQLKNYIPSGTMNKPFWCRVCQLVCKDADDFNAHMVSQNHAIAVKIEMKVSYCKVCRKQFTSPTQLEEHLIGKLHKETMDALNGPTQPAMDNTNTSKPPLQANKGGWVRKPVDKRQFSR